jgi:hypothetical protein
MRAIWRPSTMAQGRARDQWASMQCGDGLNTVRLGSRLERYNPGMASLFVAFVCVLIALRASVPFIRDRCDHPEVTACVKKSPDSPDKPELLYSAAVVHPGDPTRAMISNTFDPQWNQREESNLAMLHSVDNTRRANALLVLLN